MQFFLNWYVNSDETGATVRWGSKIFEADILDHALFKSEKIAASDGKIPITTWDEWGDTIVRETETETHAHVILLSHYWTVGEYTYWAMIVLKWKNEKESTTDA